ncbi:DNA-directed RNA polymerase III subunit RPC10 isoform X1 [Medicago truncatula]|uniref:DNA-directed RNA polymerase subunit n=3 Tax=Medicago truncatula TaxID=3880 RepID=A0A072UDK1_MEDTR|nr:DNA-directed RNA polymerase III subunit RPC10 isoform X1 [Medicago truncatula]KEH27707.1 DNA-directed RNA polymerase subunit [Medicago truncatula]
MLVLPRQNIYRDQMEFCPMCGSMLMLELPNSSHDKFHPTRFYCLTCPYICRIEKGVKIKRRQMLVRKGIDPIISHHEINKNKPKADVPCPNCRHPQASYHMQQTRSADEPATIFYECLNEKCGHKWKE